MIEKHCTIVWKFCHWCGAGIESPNHRWAVCIGSVSLAWHWEQEREIMHDGYWPCVTSKQPVLSRQQSHAGVNYSSTDWLPSQIERSLHKYREFCWSKISGSSMMSVSFASFAVLQTGKSWVYWNHWQNHRSLQWRQDSFLWLNDIGAMLSIWSGVLHKV